MRDPSQNLVEGGRVQVGDAGDVVLGDTARHTEILVGNKIDSIRVYIKDLVILDIARRL